MSVKRFFRDVICFPYSIPIGLINSEYSLDMCSESKTIDLNLSEETDNNGLYSEELVFSESDILSSSDISVLNASIKNILIDSKNISTIKVSGSNVANVHSFTIDENGNDVLILSYEEDPDGKYTDYIDKYKSRKMGDDGNIYYIYEFGCFPSIEQSQDINTVQINEINENIFEQIYNQLELSVENTLEQSGSNNPSSTFSSILTDNNVKNLIFTKINSMLTNISNQKVNVSLKLDYIDRYGKCGYNYDDKNRIKVSENNCEKKNINDLTIPKDIYGICTGGRSSVLKQTVDIDVISKNIINISIGIIMENKVKIDSENKVKINRITNHRVIVISFLFNIIIIYLLFKIFILFIQAIN
jgi:hypothetical protein